MRRNKWLLIALLTLPLAIAGLAYGQTLVRADQPQESEGYVCPLTGEVLPCPDCCPLNQARTESAPGAAKSAEVSAEGVTQAAPFICPLTGEELPCPDCCPLKRGSSSASTEE